MSDDTMSIVQASAAFTLVNMIRDLVPTWREEREAVGLWRWVDPDCDWAWRDRPRLVVVDGRRRQERVLPPGGGRVGPSVIGYCKGITVNVTLPAMVDSTDMWMALRALAQIEALPMVT